MFRRLTARYEDREQFARILAEDLSRGGLFLPCDESFEARELVEVALELRFCRERRCYQAEVVNRVDPKAIGAPAGVAVQILVPARELREELAELAGLPAPAPPPESWPTRPDGPTRRHERNEACLDAWIEGTGLSAPARTLNLSRGGALLEADVEPPAPGAPLELRLVHPRTGEPTQVSGHVVRTEPGEHALQIALEFDPETVDAEDFAARIEDSCAAAHARELGGVRGSLSAMGLTTLMQMLAPSADSGTLRVKTPTGLAATLLFEGGLLRLVEVGAARGAKALARALAWEDGEFQYVPSIRPGAPSGEPMPVEMMLLEASRQHDEWQRLDPDDLPLERVLRVTGAPCEEAGKLALDLLASGPARARVRSWLDAVPQPDSDVRAALLELLDAGALAYDDAPAGD